MARRSASLGRGNGVSLIRSGIAGRVRTSRCRGRRRGGTWTRRLREGVEGELRGKRRVRSRAPLVGVSRKKGLEQPREGGEKRAEEERGSFAFERSERGRYIRIIYNNSIF